MTDETELVRDVYAAFAARDVSAVFRLFDRSATVYQSGALPWGGAYEGHDGLAQFMLAVSTHLDSVATPDLLFADGDGHVVEAGYTRGTVRATGVRFEIAQSHLWTVREGRVQRMEAYVDAPAMLAALAATPQAPPAQ